MNVKQVYYNIPIDQDMINISELCFSDVKKDKVKLTLWYFAFLTNQTYFYNSINVHWEKLFNFCCNYLCNMKVTKKFIFLYT